MFYPVYARLPSAIPLACRNVAHNAACVALTIGEAVLASATYGAPAKRRTRYQGKVTGPGSRGLRQRWGD